MSGVARSGFHWLTAVVACVGLAAHEAHAQAFPAKPINLLVGVPPGGSSDLSARLIAQKMSEYLGQPVVVENRPGAGGSLALGRMARSAADGYTLTHMQASAALQPVLQSKLPYNLERDLAPVSLAITVPYLLVVHPSVPAHNVKQLVALARARPGGLTFGSNGVASALHFAGELFNALAKVKTFHIPYKGGVGSVVATATGEVDISYPSIASAQPFLATNKVRALAVTSAERASLLPNIPTLIEAGVPGYARAGWNGIVAPAGLPNDILTLLNSSIVKAVQTTAVRQALAAAGLEPRTSTPQEFSAFIRAEYEQNVRLVQAIGLKPE